MLNWKHQCFSIFMTSTWAQKAKLTVNFLTFTSVNFFKTWRSCNHIHLLQNTLFLWKSVRAYLIYLEKWQITEHWKNHLNNLDFLPIQNARQYHFHDVAKYEKNSPKESVDIKELRPKWGICLPAIRWDVAMVTALIQKSTTKK